MTCCTDHQYSPDSENVHAPCPPAPFLSLLFLSAEIVDGNLKMTLGMIWTIILRFAIQDISVEGRLTVQRHTHTHVLAVVLN